MQQIINKNGVDITVTTDGNKSFYSVISKNGCKHTAEFTQDVANSFYEFHGTSLHDEVISQLSTLS